MSPLLSSTAAVKTIVRDEDDNLVTLTRDMEKASTWFKAAANMGHVEAMFQAALLTAEDKGPRFRKCRVC